MLDSKYDTIAIKLIEQIFEDIAEEYCIHICTEDIEHLYNLSATDDVYQVYQRMADEITAEQKYITVYYLDDGILIINNERISWHRIW